MPIPILPLAVDWVELIIFLFIIGSSLIGKLMQANHQRGAKRQIPVPPVAKPGQANPRGNANPPGQPVRPGQQRHMAGQPPAPPGAGQAENRLESEIEAFLRKAAANKKGGVKQNAPAASPPPMHPGQTPRKQQRQETRRKGPLRPEPQEQQPFRKSESVGQHVQRHIRSGGIGEREPHLAENLENADERIEEHLHEVFDHKLGNLTSTTETISQGTDARVWEDNQQETSDMANRLFDMLSSPQQVGAAIVLSEIIRRPEERWSEDDPTLQQASQPKQR